MYSSQQTLSAVIWRLWCSSKTWLPKTLFSASCCGPHCSDTSNSTSSVSATKNPEFSTPVEPKNKTVLLQQQQLNVKPSYKLVLCTSLCVGLYTHTLSFIPPRIFRSLSVHLCSPCSLLPRPLRPRPRLWGLFINKRPLFHTQLDVCCRAREGLTMSSTMLQWAAMTTKPKQKNVYCVGFPYPEKALNLPLVLGRNTSNLPMTEVEAVRRAW